MASAPKSVETKWTAGPWFISGPFIGPRLSPDSGIILKVARTSGGETDAECIANSRLIAAAPEMAGVLLRLVEGTTDIDEIYEDARSVLAKIGAQS